MILYMESYICNYNTIVSLGFHCIHPKYSFMDVLYETPQVPLQTFRIFQETFVEDFPACTDARCNSNVSTWKCVLL